MTADCADPEPDGPLANLRVLDLAGEIGVFCGRLLAELGADVVRVEPPGGDAVRRRGPFLDGEPGVERSLYHQHFNVNKRGVTLDLEREEGRALLRALAAHADVVVESWTPGDADARDIGYEALRAQHPALVYTTITPFGREGPMRRYRGRDLTGVASSGLMALNGFPEDPPTMPGSEQGYHMASLVAASATLIAIVGRDLDPERRGRRVDVSMQEAASMPTLQHASANFYTWLRQVPARRGLSGLRGGRAYFRCGDGRWVSFVVPPYRWEEFLAWLRDERIECELFGEEWRNRAYRVQRGDRLAEVIETLVQRYPRDHIFHEGQRRRLLVTSTNTVADLVDDPQLAARDYFVSLEHEALGRTLRDGGVAFALSRTPARVWRRAPLLGEHNREVYGGLLGKSEGEIASMRKAGVI